MKSKKGHMTCQKLRIIRKRGGNLFSHPNKKSYISKINLNYEPKKKHKGNKRDHSNSCTHPFSNNSNSNDKLQKKERAKNHNNKKKGNNSYRDAQDYYYAPSSVIKNMKKEDILAQMGRLIISEEPHNEMTIMAVAYLAEFHRSLVNDLNDTSATKRQTQIEKDLAVIMDQINGKEIK